MTSQSTSRHIACVGYGWVRRGLVGQPSPHVTHTPPTCSEMPVSRQNEEVHLCHTKNLTYQVKIKCLCSEEMVLVQWDYWEKISQKSLQKMLLFLCWLHVGMMLELWPPQNLLLAHYWLHVGLAGMYPVPGCGP